ncbi:MAG: DUF2461 domain-containing protein [Bacteroidetes bacterium]|nr:MAG: DUF2461 domain-containing protein [Bacteroidota bacterium]
MIAPSTLTFLSELKANNHKEWFAANRSRYEAARNNFLDFVDHLIDGIAEYDGGVAGLEPKKCMFRINRDIRFSKNKAPYKTNFGAHIAPGGRKSPYAGYYLHLEPGQCFLAGGKYHPQPEELRAIRTHIEGHAPRLRAILAEPEFQAVYGEMKGDSLKTAPKGYPKDHPDLDLIRRKDFFVVHECGEEVMLSEEFADYVVSVFKVVQPLNAFLNEAVG